MLIGNSRAINWFVALCANGITEISDIDTGAIYLSRDLQLLRTVLTGFIPSTSGPDHICFFSVLIRTSSSTFQKRKT